MLVMHDDFLLLFPMIPQVRTIHPSLCSDLAGEYNSQSSCVVVEEMYKTNSHACREELVMECYHIMETFL